MSSPSPVSLPDLSDLAWGITADARSDFEKRLAAAGVENPDVVSSLALAALAMRLTPGEARALAESNDAAAAVQAFMPPENPLELARREAEAEGKLVVLRTFNRR